MTNPLSNIPVLVLAGGLGTRLRSVVADKPKALAPIMGKPFLEIQIELLKDQGATHFVLCVGYLSEQISETFGDGSKFGVRIDYSEGYLNCSTSSFSNSKSLIILLIVGLNSTKSTMIAPESIRKK